MSKFEVTGNGKGGTNPGGPLSVILERSCEDDLPPRENGRGSSDSPSGPLLCDTQPEWGDLSSINLGDQAFVGGMPMSMSKLSQGFEISESEFANLTARGYKADQIDRDEIVLGDPNLISFNTSHNESGLAAGRKGPGGGNESLGAYFLRRSSNPLRDSSNNEVVRGPGPPQSSLPPYLNISGSSDLQLTDKVNGFLNQIQSQLAMRNSYYGPDPNSNPPLDYNIVGTRNADSGIQSQRSSGTVGPPPPRPDSTSSTHSIRNDETTRIRRETRRGSLEHFAKFCGRPESANSNASDKVMEYVMKYCKENVEPECRPSNINISPSDNVSAFEPIEGPMPTHHSTPVKKQTSNSYESSGTSTVRDMDSSESHISKPSVQSQEVQTQGPHLEVALSNASKLQKNALPFVLKYPEDQVQMHYERPSLPGPIQRCSTSTNVSTTSAATTTSTATYQAAYPALPPIIIQIQCPPQGHGVGVSCCHHSQNSQNMMVQQCDSRSSACCRGQGVGAETNPPRAPVVQNSSSQTTAMKPKPDGDASSSQNLKVVSDKSIVAWGSTKIGETSKNTLTIINWNKVDILYRCGVRRSLSEAFMIVDSTNKLAWDITGSLAKGERKVITLIFRPFEEGTSTGEFVIKIYRSETSSRHQNKFKGTVKLIGLGGQNKSDETMNLDMNTTLMSQYQQF